MDFCKLCDNMLYIVQDNSEKPFMKCRNCGSTAELCQNNGTGRCLYKSKKSNENGFVKLIFNKNIKYDKTLPRVNNIVCPNKDCTKKKDDKNNVIYLKTDAKKMTYMYSCTYCDYFWKN